MQRLGSNTGFGSIDHCHNSYQSERTERVGGWWPDLPGLATIVGATWPPVGDLIRISRPIGDWRALRDETLAWSAGSGITVVMLARAIPDANDTLGQAVAALLATVRLGERGSSAVDTISVERAEASIGTSHDWTSNAWPVAVAPTRCRAQRVVAPSALRM